jgi:hypothetical protein
MLSYFLFSITISAILLGLLYIFQKKKGNQKSFLFYTGIAYILVGLPIIYSFYILIALVSIVLGLFFIFLSRFQLNSGIQIILSITPIVCYSIVTFYSMSSYNIFLIPKGYIGRILIVHGCKDGAKKEFEGRYRLYKIPQNGILKTQFNFAGSSFDHLHSKYFYIDKNNNREPIQDTIQESTISIQGLWSLPVEKKGETPIDFIIDYPVTNFYSYQAEKNELWQREIDSCL